MKYILIMSLSFLSLFGCKGYSNLKADAFEAMLAEDRTAQLVDVRTPDEYAEGHLAGIIVKNYKGDAQ